MNRLPRSLAILVLLLGVGSASAEAITFAGLSGIEAPVPNGYGGFH